MRRWLRSRPGRPRWLGTALVLAAAWLLGQLTGPGEARVPAWLQFEEWEYLSDRPWRYADTGWLMVGNEGLPTVDGTFLTGQPLTLGEHTYGKGFGVYTPSEIAFDLEGAFARLEAVVGVEPDERPEPPEQRRVVFSLYADDALLVETPPLAPGEEPYPVTASLRGVLDLRLVTRLEEGAPAGARAVWADVRVLRASNPLDADALAEVRLAQQARARRQQRLQDNLAVWSDESRAALEALAAAPDAALPAPGETGTSLVRGAGWLGLANGETVAQLMVAGPNRGQLAILQREPERYAARGLTVALELPNGALAPLGEAEAQPDQAALAAVDDPALGAGARLSVPFVNTPRGIGATVAVTLFAAGGPLLLDVDASAAAGAGAPVGVRYRTAPGGAVFTGVAPHYVTSLVRLRHLPLHDDGLERADYLGWSNPLYLYDRDEAWGLLLAALDETRMPPLARMRRGTDQVAAALDLQLEALPDGGGVRAPSLLVQPVHRTSIQRDFAHYRRVMEARAPALALPAWLGPQWLSWYVYYMEITEEVLVRQIDQIAEHFADLGPWHIIVDAGWYWAEGRPGAEWQRVDRAKFPRGLRWLVDYAHSKGVRVVLYFTAPYLNTNEGAGNWLGLRGIVEDHPDWVLPLDDGRDPPVDYVYDFANPELRAYLRDVFRNYWVVYGVDGIKLDGLGSSGESVLVSREGALFGLSAKSVAQTLEVYRFVYEEAIRHNPGAYIESGWLTPTLANRYAHTFRYGDEEPSFSRVYPLPGLIEHIDFTAYQQAVLGQRSNIGAVWGDANESVINLWWLGAALALDAQVAISVDLGVLTPESISAYRSFLAHYRPFAGVTTIDQGVEQEVFSTRRDGVHYVGVLNRSPERRTFEVTAEQLGLQPGQPFAVLDTERGDGEVAVDGFSVTLEPESFRLLTVRADPGVLWGNVRARPAGPNGWALTAPPTVPGELYLYAHDHQTLYWDGVPLAQGATGDQTPRFEPLSHSSLVRVTFPPGGAHRLQVEP